MTAKEFGRRFRRLAYDRNIGAAYIAAQLDVTPNCVYEWLNGRHLPRTDKLDGIAKALGLKTWEQLLGRVDA